MDRVRHADQNQSGNQNQHVDHGVVVLQHPQRKIEVINQQKTALC